mmetsp:Transcript_103233/g.274520  ORF Transcript_103233/g.274520 Transcript_103233/m.274520 type:complete len:200 (-) Transcript_103233:512-1111(-)
MCSTLASPCWLPAAWKRSSACSAVFFALAGAPLARCASMTLAVASTSQALLVALPAALAALSARSAKGSACSGSAWHMWKLAKVSSSSASSRFSSIVLKRLSASFAARVALSNDPLKACDPERPWNDNAMPLLFPICVKSSCASIDVFHMLWPFSFCSPPCLMCMSSIARAARPSIRTSPVLLKISFAAVAIFMTSLAS